MTDNSRLTLEVALTLICEKARFWSDDRIDFHGKTYPPRCMNPDRLKDLRQSLIEIADHCAVALRKSRQERERDSIR